MSQGDAHFFHKLSGIRLAETAPAGSPAWPSGEGDLLLPGQDGQRVAGDDAGQSLARILRTS